MDDADLPLTQQRPAWITLVIPALALAALTLLVYWPGLSGPMIFDDLPLLTGPGSVIHRTLRDPASLLRVTRPLVDVTFTSQYLIHGQWPMGYRLGNVALHLLAGWILLDLIRRTLSAPVFNRRWEPLATPLATVIAGLWLLHPVNTQAVTYLIQRSEVMASLMIFLSLDALAMAWGGGRAGRLMLGISALACVGAMLSKEIGYLCPVLTWLYARCFWAGSFKAAWREHRLYFIAITLMLLLPWFMGLGAMLVPPDDDGTGGVASAGMGVRGVGPMLYFFTQQTILVHYLELIFWPATLVLDYRYALMEPASFTCWPAIAPALALTLMVTLGVATLWLLWRRPPGAPAGFLGAWFFLLMAPTSSFLPIVDLAMEHRLYAAGLAVIAGVVMLTAAAFQCVARRWPASIPHHRLAAALLALLAMAALGARTFHRNGDYSQARVIWSKVLDARPGNTRAMLILGAMEEQAGRSAQALALYRQAARTEPTNYEPMIALGSLYLQQDQPGQARRWYEMSWRISGDRRTYLMNMGLVAQTQGEPAQAIRFFQQAMEQGGPGVKLLANLGMAQDQLATSLLAQGQSGQAMDMRMQAIAHLEQALSMDPAWEPARVNLATAYLNLGMQHQLAGDGQAARRAMERSLQIQPRAQTARRLAWLLVTWEPLPTQDASIAVDLARRALASVGGGQPVYMDTLAAALARAKQFDQAVKWQREAIQVARDAGVDEGDLEPYRQRLAAYEAGRPWSVSGSVQP